MLHEVYGSAHTHKAVCNVDGMTMKRLILLAENTFLTYKTLTVPMITGYIYKQVSRELLQKDTPFVPLGTLVEYDMSTHYTRALKGEA